VAQGLAPLYPRFADFAQQSGLEGVKSLARGGGGDPVSAVFVVVCFEMMCCRTLLFQLH